MTEQITYDVSLQLTKTIARHGCTPDWVRVYLPTVIDESEQMAIRILNERKENQEDRFDDTLFTSFYVNFVYAILIERFCLAARINNRVRVERGLPKKLIKGRCKPYAGYSCKLDYITNKIYHDLD